MTKNLDLKKVREELGLTQEQLADRVGVNRKTILAYEKDPTQIPTTKLKFLEVVINSIQLEQNKFSKKSRLTIVKDAEEKISADIIKKLMPLLRVLVEKNEEILEAMKNIDGRLETTACEMDGIKMLLEIGADSKK